LGQEKEKGGGQKAGSSEGNQIKFTRQKRYARDPLVACPKERKEGKENENRQNGGVALVM